MPVDSPIVRNQGSSVPDYETKFEVRTNSIKTSKTNVGELPRLSDAGTASGDFSTDTALNLTTTLTFNNPFAASKMMAIPYVALYQGTVVTGTAQIYPIRGSGVTLGRYDVQGAFDYQGWDLINARWRGMVVDSNGTSAQSVTFVARWMYIDYKSTASV